MTENRPDDDRPAWATDPQTSSPGGVHETVAFGAPDLDGPQPHGAVPAEHSKAARRITRGGAVGLVAAGLLSGGLGVAALASTSKSSTSKSSTTSSPASAASSGGGLGSVGGLGSAGGVGRDGEQHVNGTLTAVSGTSITVKTTAGATSSYPVTSQTEVLKDGTRSTVSALKTGDIVSVHVLTSGSSPVVERIFAGQLHAFGGGRFGDGDGGPPPGVGSDGTPPTGTLPGGSIPGGSGTGGTTGGTSTTTT